jgi:phospholipase/carboxylesterase
MLTRRYFIRMSSLAAAGLPLSCLSNTSGPDEAAGRLQARPRSPTEPLAPGRHDLQLGSSRDGFLYIPTGYQHGQATPLLVLFHGAGQRASEWSPAQAIADSLGAVLLVPDSRGVSWDAVRGSYGPDVIFVDTALNKLFGHVSVDPARIALAGFSDGASYALTLGTINGDFVTHIIAFSPGLIAPGVKRGKPRIYVTHGTRDTVLPIDLTSRRIVPALRADDYPVTYNEFDGGHTMAGQIMTDGFQWFVGGTAGA